MGKLRRENRFLAWVLMLFMVIGSISFLPSFGSSVEAAEMKTVEVKANAMYSYAYEVLDLVNEERKSRGLKPLTMDRDLLEAAMQRAAENVVSYVSKSTLDHDRPDGSSCFTVCNKSFGENLAAGQVSPQNVMKSWMNSTGHRSNILNSEYQSIGVGCVMVNGGLFVFWAQEFGYYMADTCDKPEDGVKTYTISVPSGVYNTLKGKSEFGTVIFDKGKSGGDDPGKDPGKDPGNDPGKASQDHSGWVQKNGQWYYYGKNNTCLTGWQKLGGKWYYFSDDGVMQTGWKQIGKKWYYLSKDGSMVTGWKKIAGVWYYFAPSGVMKTGWQMIGGKWYYLGGGAMRTGWLKSAGEWYYLDSAGVMQTGDCRISGKLYRFGSDGICMNPYNPL